jgi:serine/threonine protein kinase
LGIVLIEMADGDPPNSGNKLGALFSIGTGDESVGLKNPSAWSASMNHFVKKCLRHNPLDRGTASKLLEVGKSSFFFCFILLFNIFFQYFFDLYFIIGFLSKCLA